MRTDLGSFAPDGRPTLNHAPGLATVDTAAATLVPIDRKPFSFGSDLASGGYVIYRDGVEFMRVGAEYMNMMPFGNQPLYRAAGRHGSWLMSNRCSWFDLDSGANVWVQHLAGQPVDGQIYGRAAAYSRLRDGMALCVNGALNEFTRYDVETREVRHFATDRLGLLVRSVAVANDHVLVDATLSSTGQRRFHELRFDTGAVVDLGPIETADRRIVQFVRIGE